MSGPRPGLSAWQLTHISMSVQELDFVHEADNAERCRANFQSSASNIKGRVAIPWVVRELSSRRVLTMEYIEGIKVTDKAQLEAAGISPSDVAKVVSTVFNEMIFIFGDVHCDPHAVRSQLLSWLLQKLHASKVKC